MWTLPLADNEGLALYVIERMREWDRREIFATRWDDSDAALLAEMMAGNRIGQRAWISGRDHEPIAVYGCLPLWPGVWSMWMLATDNLRHIGKSMTKRVRADIVPALFGEGAHRLECRSMVGHIDAQRWLQVVGARCQVPLHAYGREREDFLLYTWEAGDVLR